MRDYIAADDTGFLIQLKNFTAKLPTHQATFGLTAQQIADVQKDYEFLHFVITSFHQAKNYRKSWAKVKDNARKGKGAVVSTSLPVPPDTSSPPPAVAPGIGRRFRAFVQHLKTHPAYTEAIGEGLGIEMPGHRPDFDNYKPEFTVTVFRKVALVKYKKKRADGVEIFKSVDGGEYHSLGRDNRPPFEDKSTLPPGKSEEWSYKLAYFKNDKHIGQWSNIVVVSVTG